MFRVAVGGIVFLIETIKMEEEKTHIEAAQPEETLLLRYIRGTVTDTERSRVEDWLGKDDEHERILTQLARIYYTNRSVVRMEARDPLAAYGKVERRMSQRIRRSWLRRVSAVAACLIGVLVVSTLISYVRVRPTALMSQTITVHANAGMRAKFDLPDGTIAYLNSGSTLSYSLPYEGEERRVTLSGEGYFKVTHDKRRPFIVCTKEDRYQVKVLGTEFNIQAYENEDLISTTLVNGLVHVEIGDKRGKVYQERLAPSEKAVYNRVSGKMRIEKVNTIYETDWIEGKLMFKESPLPAVLKKLSSYYNVNFTVKDAVIEGYLFTGTFENRQLSQVLDYLKITSKMDYRIEEMKMDDSEGVNRTHVILWKRK